VFLKELADNYFSTGQWEEARRYAKAAGQNKALDNPIKNHGLEYFAVAAEQMPEQIERWSKSPMVAQPTQITLRANKGEAAHTHFGVESFRSVDPVVTCESPYGEYNDTQPDASQHARASRRAPLHPRPMRRYFYTMRLSTDTMRLSTDTMRLSTDTMRLSADTIRLSSDTMRLSACLKEANSALEDASTKNYLRCC